MQRSRVVSNNALFPPVIAVKALHVRETMVRTSKITDDKRPVRASAPVFLLLCVPPPTSGPSVPLSRVAAATEGTDAPESRPVDRRNFLVRPEKRIIGLLPAIALATASSGHSYSGRRVQRASAAPGLVRIFYPKHRWRRPPPGRHGAAAFSARAPGNCSGQAPGLGRPIWPHCTHTTSASPGNPSTSTAP